MITAGVGPALVAMVVLGEVGWLGASGGHGWIAVRSGPSCRRGRPVLALGDLPLSETRDSFSSLISLFLIRIYVYNEFL